MLLDANSLLQPHLVDGCYRAHAFDSRCNFRSGSNELNDTVRCTVDGSHLALIESTRADWVQFSVVANLKSASAEERMSTGLGPSLCLESYVVSLVVRSHVFPITMDNIPFLDDSQFSLCRLFMRHRTKPFKTGHISVATPLSLYVFASRFTGVRKPGNINKSVLESKCRVRYRLRHPRD